MKRWRVHILALFAVAAMLLTAFSAPAMAETFVPVNDGFVNDGFFVEPFFFAGNGVVVEPGFVAGPGGVFSF